MQTRYMDPWALFGELRREVDRAFGEYGSTLRGGNGRSPRFPAMNLWDTGPELRVEAELPGLTQEDVQIFAVGNELTIRGQRDVALPEGATFHRRERGTGEFTRTVTLPAEVDAERIDATLRNGVLTITLPKAAAARPRKIEVKAN